jgi:hypothetical protein
LDSIIDVVPGADVARRLAMQPLKEGTDRKAQRVAGKDAMLAGRVTLCLQDEGLYARSLKETRMGNARNVAWGIMGRACWRNPVEKRGERGEQALESSLNQGSRSRTPDYAVGNQRRKTGRLEQGSTVTLS